MNLCQVRGYAAVFNQWSVPLDHDGEPFLEIIRPKAFGALVNQITATIMHRDHRIGGTWDHSLKLWQDGYGVAIELAVPCTTHGLGLRDMVDSGFNSMSFGLIAREWTTYRNDDGVEVRDITSAGMDHVTICEAGAFRGSCCWTSDMPVERMSPKIAAASRHWFLGRIHRDQKQASNQAMLARYRAAKTAAPPRGPRGRAEPILIHGMDPKEYARSIDVRF
jgi:phage head maturation protease